VKLRLKPSTAGKIATTNITNRIVAAVNGLNAEGGAGDGRDRRIQPITALIWDAGPGGEADWVDDRYWFRRARSYNPDSDGLRSSLKLREIGYDATTAQPYDWAVATNSTEVLFGSHKLPKGTPVTIWPIPNADGTTLFYFEHSPDDGRFAVIQCCGPRGCITDPDFQNERYWFKWAEILTDGADPKQPLLLGTGEWPEYDDPDASGSAGSGSGDDAQRTRHGLPFATHLAETSCHSHLLKKGDWVWVRTYVDVGDPPTLRYWIEHANLNSCNPECDQSSSSSSSSTSSSSSSPSSSQSSSESASSSESQSESDSGSEPNESGSGGSSKNSAIVPVAWSSTNYAALFVTESPEVCFHDVIVVDGMSQVDGIVQIDPRFVSVCEPGSIEVIGHSSNLPVVMGAIVEQRRMGAYGVRLRFATKSKRRKLRLVFEVSGIRKGFKGLRFPERTREQFQANERLLQALSKGTEKGKA
jgi:hypothetical protein